MRLTSGFWVSAYLRRCSAAGAFGAVVNRGAEEAGAIHIKINFLDGRARLFSPAPQSFLEEDGRLWLARGEGEPAGESEIDRLLASERRFDPDLWIVEIEDRQGRDFLTPDEVAVRT